MSWMADFIQHTTSNCRSMMYRENPEISIRVGQLTSDYRITILRKPCSSCKCQRSDKPVKTNDFVLTSKINSLPYSGKRSVYTEFEIKITKQAQAMLQKPCAVCKRTNIPWTDGRVGTKVDPVHPQRRCAGYDE